MKAGKIVEHFQVFMDVDEGDTLRKALEAVRADDDFELSSDEANVVDELIEGLKP